MLLLLPWFYDIVFGDGTFASSIDRTDKEKKKRVNRTDKEKKKSE